MSLDAFAAAAVQGRLDVRTDARSRCLYAGRRFGINGEVLPAADFDRRLARLADLGRVDANLLRGAPAKLLARLHEWHVAGWLHCEVR